MLAVIYNNRNDHEDNEKYLEKNQNKSIKTSYRKFVFLMRCLSILQIIILLVLIILIMELQINEGIGILKFVQLTSLMIVNMFIFRFSIGSNKISRLKNIVVYEIVYKIYKKLFTIKKFNLDDGFTDKVHEKNIFAQKYYKVKSFCYIRGLYKNNTFELSQSVGYKSIIKSDEKPKKNKKLKRNAHKEKIETLINRNRYILIVKTNEFISAPFYIASKHRGDNNLYRVLEKDYNKFETGNAEFERFFDYYTIYNVNFFHDKMDNLNNLVMFLKCQAHYDNLYYPVVNNTLDKQELLVYCYGNEVIIEFKSQMHFMFPTVKTFTAKGSKTVKLSLDNIENDILFKSKTLMLLIDAFN